MSAKSLPDMPPELVLEIYKSMDTIAAATALSKTSRYFHNISTASFPSICVAIIGRSIACFDQACELVDAQAKTAAMILHPDCTPPILERTKRFLLNAELADEALKHFNIAATQGMPFDSPRCRDMTSTETDTFLRAYYRAMSLISQARRYTWNGVLAWKMLDIFQVVDVLYFLSEYCKCTPDHMETQRHQAVPSKGIARKDLVIATGRDIIRLHHNLIHLPANACFKNHCRWYLKYPSMVDEAYKDAEGDGRGVSLSQLYPSLLEETKDSLPYML